MKRILMISFLIAAVAFVADAQLIEDSQSRLKTTTVKRKGFLFFRNKKQTKNSNGIPNGGSSSAPRYSSIGSPFRLSRGESPRYSSPTKKIRKYSANPRYSVGRVTRFKDWETQPRYTDGRNPFRGYDFRVFPRYSQASPFRGKDYKISPRYSRGNPFKGYDFRTSPRYSQGSPFRARDHRVSPRYSAGSPFSGKDYNVNPRYSAGSPFKGVNYKVNPRYTNLKKPFHVDKGLKKQLQYYNENSNWKGDLKVSHKRIGDQHPSSNYHMAMKFHSPHIRKMFRKWNVFWVRLNGNKLYSDGVKEKIQEPKFDKKERVLWNN